VGPRAGLDRCGKSHLPPGFDPRTISARSESVYRLSYPGPHALHDLSLIKLSLALWVQGVFLMGYRNGHTK
jgi:hypothetical protein